MNKCKSIKNQVIKKKLESCTYFLGICVEYISGIPKPNFKLNVQLLTIYVDEVVKTFEVRIILAQ